MRGHAGLRVGIACGRHGVNALQEGLSSFGSARIPAELRDRQFIFMTRRGAPQPRVHLGEAPGVFDRRPDAI